MFKGTEFPSPGVLAVGASQPGAPPEGFFPCRSEAWLRRGSGAAGQGGTLLTVGAFRTESRAQVCALLGTWSLLLVFSKGSGVCGASCYSAGFSFPLGKLPFPALRSVLSIGGCRGGDLGC